MSTPVRPHRGQSARRRAPAVLAVLALALAAGAVATTPAHAASSPVEGGTLSWGFKESFRNYVGRQTAALPPIGPAPEGERISVSGGATFDADGTPTYPGSSSSPNETLPYTFSVDAGSVEDVENFVVRSSGAVTYHFPSHHFDLTISGLGVVVESGTARLVGDVLQVATEDFGEFEEGEYRLEDGTIGTVASVDVTIDGGTLLVRGTGLAVHADAAAALPQAAGEVLDDFSLTASLGAAVEDPSTPSPRPTPTPDPGELSWRFDGGVGAVSLGTATVTDDGFLATAALPTVVVEDSRAGGPGWRATAEASDFSTEGAVLRARHLGWVPVLVTPGGGAVAGAPVPPRLASSDGKGKGLGVPRVLGSAPAGHPQGAAHLGGTLELLAPPGAAPGSYRAVLTITVVS